MAAGCKSIALDHVDSASEVSAPPEVNSSGRRCSACKQLAKDHLGPIGPSKCLVSVLHALTERVEILERELRIRTREALFDEEHKLTEARNEAFLATIAVLEERVHVLEASANRPDHDCGSHSTSAEHSLTSGSAPLCRVVLEASTGGDSEKSAPVLELSPLAQGEQALPVVGEDMFGSSSLKEDSFSLKEDSQQPVQRKVMFSVRE